LEGAPNSGSASRCSRAIARIDEDLRGGRVQRGREHDVEQRQQEGDGSDPEDQRAAPLDDADELFQVDARIIVPGRHWGRGVLDHAPQRLGNPLLQHSAHLARRCRFGTPAPICFKSSQDMDQRSGKPSFAALTARH